MEEAALLFIVRTTLLLTTDCCSDDTDLGVHGGTNGNSRTTPLGHNGRRIAEVETIANRDIELVGAVSVDDLGD